MTGAVFFKGLMRVGRDILFPATCTYCGELFRPSYADTTHLATSSHATPSYSGPLEPVEGATAGLQLSIVLSHFLCPRCIHRYHLIASPLCISCGVPFISPYGPDHLCGQCERFPNHYRRARATGRYQGALRALIHQYKYQGRTQLAAPLGRILWEVMVQHFHPTGFDMVIPVPLHGQRLRKRGFNQASLLLRQWPAFIRAWSLSMDDGPSLRTDILTRNRRTLPQTGLDKAQRLSNLSRAFRVDHVPCIKGRRLLLIDDVLTTGATVNACARVLKRAGAACVDVLTLARAV